MRITADSQSDRRRASGIALLVVIMLGAILVPFAAEFAYQITLEAITANNVADQLAIDNAIESQYQIVLARLRHDGQGNEVDSYEDSWNDEALRSRTEEESNVRLESTVFDEQGKINILMLAKASPERRAVWKERLVRLIEIYRQDTKWDATSHANDLVNDLDRWVRGEANRGNIPKPKTIDDRAMLLLEELNFVSEIVEKEQLLVDRREGEETAPGLHRYVTIHGTGKINLNTASKVVLQACFPNDPEIADRIIERREGTMEEDEGDVIGSDDEEQSGNPFTDPNQVLEVEGVTQPLLVSNKVVPADDFTVRSNFFSVRIVGQTRGSRRDELFVLERVPGDDPKGAIEGFRHLLCQERTDPLEADPEEEEP
jgi:type II secretory pathway component PulK